MKKHSLYLLGICMTLGMIAGCNENKNLKTNTIPIESENSCVIAFDDTSTSNSSLESTVIDSSMFEETELQEQISAAEMILSESQNHVTKSKNCLSIYYISQYPDFPTGCEGCSAIMALAHVGVIMDPEMFFRKYLKTSDWPFDPDMSFGGNPRDYSGFGCFAPALCSAMNQALQYVPYKAVEIQGRSLENLCEMYINNNIPVIIWGSIDMAKMKVNSIWMCKNKKIVWKTPEHCLLLVGYDESNYIFNDPMRGKNVRYSKKSVDEAYQQMGKQAVIISRDPFF